jgi:hypothetical protein
MKKTIVIYIHPTNGYSDSEIENLFNTHSIKVLRNKIPLCGSTGKPVDVFKIFVDGLKILAENTAKLKLSYEIHRKTTFGLTYFVGVIDATGVSTPFIVRNKAPHTGRYPAIVRHQKLLATLSLQNDVSPLADVPQIRPA